MEKATVLFLLAVLTFDLRIHQHTESMQRLHKYQRTYVHFEVSRIYVTLHFCGFHDEPANKGQPSLTDPLIGVGLGCNRSVRGGERERQ